MAKMILTTQVYENYGAHDWDGEGECPQYWKAKGGNDFVVLNVDINRAMEIADAATKQINESSVYFQETVIAWEVVADDYLTEFERSQLEYEGEVRYGPIEIVIDEMVDYYGA